MEFVSRFDNFFYLHETVFEILSFLLLLRSIKILSQLSPMYIKCIIFLSERSEKEYLL